MPPAPNIANARRVKPPSVQVLREKAAFGKAKIGRFLIFSDKILMVVRCWSKRFMRIAFCGHWKGWI